MDPFVTIGTRAARKAGDYIVRHIDRLDSVRVGRKEQNDFVTEVDQAAERIIVEEILRAYPDHAVLGEEFGEQNNEDGDKEYMWIIDPLDGTTNFIHGFPVFAVSIALQQNGRTIAAVIYDPSRDELFTAARGKGAFLDRRRIRATSHPALKHALIGTGFPFRKGQDVDKYLAMFRAVMEKTSGIRRPGSAALDLAWLAAGRVDGFWEMGLKPWDIAAGCLIIEEAGGMVTDFAGDGNYLESGDVVAGGMKVHSALLQELRQAGL